EIVNYSIIVLVAVVVLTAFIAGLDWVFSNFVLDLFE
ncbi:MAG: preprotein translocase subunit SecE, partial [Acidimicrobiia bacterium]|nr:preprotein translocase subunit SecE [Acidimicrobiia bacterium]